MTVFKQEKMKQTVVILLVFFLLPIFSFGQCRGYSKKQCLPKLNNYIHTGQLNSARLSTGEQAEFMLTFYAGQDYRIIVCAEDVFEGITFKVKTSKRKLLFNSQQTNNTFFDFRVASTQKLIITFIAPEKNEKNKDVKGCVTSLVGFKF